MALDTADRGLVEACELLLFRGEGLAGDRGEPQRPGDVLLECRDLGEAEQGLGDQELESHGVGPPQ